MPTVIDQPLKTEDTEALADYIKIHKKLLNPTSPEDLTETYNSFQTYDELLDGISYAGPAVVVQVVSKYVKDKNSRFLDVGAGTGKVAEELLKAGYTGNTDGFDPTTGFAKTAIERGLYKKFIHEYLVVDKQCSVPSETYDHVTSCGSFIPGHIRYQCISDLLRITKKGGRVIICLRKDYLLNEEFKGIDEYLENLKKKNIAEIETFEFPGYYSDFPGYIIIAKKM